MDIIFNVMLIAEELATAIGTPYHLRQQMIEYILHHDIPEVVLGDVPTPVKALLNHSDDALLNGLQADADPLSVSGYGRIYDIAKLADTLEAITFLALHGVGRHAKSVKDQMIDTVWKMIADWPQDILTTITPIIGRIFSWETQLDEWDNKSWYNQE